MPSIHTLTLNNHTLTYTAAGSPDAPPLLMVHGWTSYRGVWRQTMEAFQDRYYCVALDLLGCGHSDKPADADYSISAQGQRVLQFADALGIDHFTLMGHSMGGQIALCMASMLAPERVTNLVSVAGVVAARLTSFVEENVYRGIALGRRFPWIYKIGEKLVDFRWYSRFSFRSWFYNMDAIPFDDWEVDRRMAVQPAAYISTYKAGEAIHGLNLTPHLAKITVPILAVAGRQDAVVPVSDSELIQQHVPNSRLVWIDECGHFPMYEQTGQYLEALRGFL